MKILNIRVFRGRHRVSPFRPQACGLLTSFVRRRRRCLSGAVAASYAAAAVFRFIANGKVRTQLSAIATSVHIWQSADRCRSARADANAYERVIVASPSPTTGCEYGGRSIAGCHTRSRSSAYRVTPAPLVVRRATGAVVCSHRFQRPAQSQHTQHISQYEPAQEGGRCADS